MMSMAARGSRSRGSTSSFNSGQVSRPFGSLVGRRPYEALPARQKVKESRAPPRHARHALGIEPRSRTDAAMVSPPRRRIPCSAVDPRARTSVAFATACAVIAWVAGGLAVGAAVGLGVLLVGLLLNGMIVWRGGEATPLLPALAGFQRWVGIVHHLVLQLVELLVAVLAAVWTLIGAVSYLKTTDGSLSGLLTLLDAKWKGVLILAGLLMLRSIQEVLARTRRFALPWLEQVPVEPSEEPTLIDDQERQP